MRVAFLSPLPPVRSGIADYSAMLLPALTSWADVTAVVQQQETLEPNGVPVISLATYQKSRDRFDAVIYQIGNNPHHEFVYREAMEYPGVVVLHDYVLHHLIVEMTLARGDAEGYIRMLTASHGKAGEAWARGRAAGFEQEAGNFLFPASAELARRARSIIVHNEFAKTSLRDQGVTCPVAVVDHPSLPANVSEGTSKRIRRRHGVSDDERIVGMLGFVTAAKRAEIVFEAFSRAVERRPSMKLLIVGEPASNVDLEALAVSLAVPREKWIVTGYVADSEFDAYIASMDRIVNLRYPTAGETSGTLVRALAQRKPVAVNNFAQFSELSSAVTQIPFGATEVASLTRFMIDDDMPDASGDAGPALFLPATAAEAYRLAVTALSVTHSARVPAVRVTPLFTALKGRVAIRTDARVSTMSAQIVNEGFDTIHALLFGTPTLRFRLRARRERTVVAESTFDVDRDLGPGEEFDSQASIIPGPFDRIELTSFLEGYPSLSETMLAIEEHRIDTV
ncbi:MAG TPA: glycosyltransferase [Thermoanaerobaculia bacterium]|nr:glycosyltransferase [Thermoanaerobaculia bacterium]